MLHVPVVARVRFWSALLPELAFDIFAAHVQGGHVNEAGLSAGASSSSMPVLGSPPSTSAAGTNIPANKEKTDGNVYFECTNCQKRVSRLC
jgi:hypothetical protein